MMNRRMTFAIGVAVGVLATGTVAVARTELRSDRRIVACVDETGDVRVLDAGDSCGDGEERLAWNKRGRPGVAGQAGPQGETGARGPAGAPGPRGAPGASDSFVVKDGNGRTLGTFVDGTGNQLVLWTGDEYLSYFNDEYVLPVNSTLYSEPDCEGMAFVYFGLDLAFDYPTYALTPDGPREFEYEEARVPTAEVTRSRVNAGSECENITADTFNITRVTVGDLAPTPPPLPLTVVPAD